MTVIKNIMWTKLWNICLKN